MGSQILVRAGAELGDSPCTKSILGNLESRTDSRTADAIRKHLSGDDTPTPTDRLPLVAEDGPATHSQQVGKVVFSGVQAPQTDEQRQHLARYRNLVGRALPLTGQVDSRLVGAALRREAPWLEPAIKTICRSLDACLIGWGVVTLRPILLVGPPGTGKSWIAKRIGELLGLKTLEIAAAGKSDNRSIEGTARGFNTGRPGALVEYIATEKIANPLVVVDEVDKISSSNHNGSLHDSLHQLLERQNSRQWVDDYLAAPCDLSYASWIATANRIDRLPQSLLSRFQVINVPKPGLEHRAAMLHSVLASIEREENVGYALHQQMTLIEWNAIYQHATEPREAREMIQEMFSIKVGEALLRPH